MVGGWDCRSMIRTCTYMRAFFYNRLIYGVPPIDPDAFFNDAVGSIKVKLISHNAAYTPYYNIVATAPALLLSICMYVI